MHGIEEALRQSGSDAVFIGSTEIRDFPLELVVELVRNYQGESFLGYQSVHQGVAQPLFGIYSKKLVESLNEGKAADLTELMQLLARDGKLLPLPDPTLAEQLNLR